VTEVDFYPARSNPGYQEQTMNDANYTVYMINDNKAIVAVQLFDDTGSEKACYHMNLIRLGSGVWVRYDLNTGKWDQLFGLYEGIGEAMTYLPGRQVDDVSQLPNEKVSP
jgi:hypothetical protein